MDKSVGVPLDSQRRMAYARKMPDYAIERTRGGLVAGSDEAGRGPLAGPVVAAAVILMPDRLPADLLAAIDDSKRLKPEIRERVAARLLYHARNRDGVVAAIAANSVAEIDRINILQASLSAMCRAVHRLPLAPDLVLIDGSIVPRDLPCLGEAIIGGDALSLSIAAASIIAKVTRDRVMRHLARRYPDYGWERNAGYPTVEHRAQISRFGITPHHRLSFGELRNYRIISSA
jgi:ribonuclease HII